MKTIKLQEENYFTYSDDRKDLVVMGELTGDFILCEHIKCGNFQAVICSDTKEIFLIER